MLALTKLVSAVLALIYAQSATALPGVAAISKRSNDLIRIPLTEDATTGLYTFRLSLGGGDIVQDLTVILDTGSYSTWVPGAKCTPASCPGVVSTYDPGLSTTAVDLNTTMNFYFDQGSVTSDIYADDLTIIGATGGGVELNNFTFGAAFKIVGFPSDSTHGRLGLSESLIIEELSRLAHPESGGYRKRQTSGGYPAIYPGSYGQSAIHGTPNKKRNNVHLPQFTLGIDPTIISGETYYFPLVSQNDIDTGASIYWKTKLSTVDFNKKAFLQSHKATVSFESGTYEIIAPCTYAEKINKLIGEPQQGDYIFMCEDVHRAGNLTFDFPCGNRITLPSSAWSQDIGNGLCESLVRSSPNVESKAWVFGTSVTNHFVQILDQASLQFGLALTTYRPAVATVSRI